MRQEYQEQEESEISEKAVKEKRRRQLMWKKQTVEKMEKCCIIQEYIGKIFAMETQ